MAKTKKSIGITFRQIISYVGFLCNFSFLYLEIIKCYTQKDTPILMLLLRIKSLPYCCVNIMNAFAYSGAANDQI